MDTASRAFEYLYRRIYMEKRIFQGYRPSEYRRLEDLLAESEPAVRLVSGQLHRFRSEELLKLNDMLPWFLRGFARLPFFFTYRRAGYRGVYKLAGPDRWAARILSYVLDLDFSKEKWELTPAEMKALIAKFKSLVIISLDIDL